MSLPKRYRLLLKRENIATLRKRGKHIVTPLLSAFYATSEGGGHSRFAVIVGSTISKKAVIRNRLRRVIHEAARAELPRLPGADIVIYPKREIVEAEREKIQGEITLLIKQIKKMSNS